MSTAILHKMTIKNSGSLNGIIANYSLRLDNGELDLNPLVGKHINLQYLGTIFCIKCGKKTTKSFGQGYCYPCFISAPENEECVFRPELCRAHLGQARDIEFAKQHCLIDHYVYLAWSGGLKVGVTRHHQIPTRWLDQGATKAIILCKTPNRYSAGMVEVELKNIFADKTNWQNMLKGKEDEMLRLTGEKAKALEYINDKGLDYSVEVDYEYRIEYPLQYYPEKLKSTSFEKETVFSGVLKGIKGQYLILEGGLVFNVRNHSGYHVEIK
jgi:hypothetical protein